MTRLLRLLRMPVVDRKLLIRTAILLWMVRLGLWILPYQRLQDLLTKKTHKSIAVGTAELASIQRITRSVKRMSRYVPAATCLTQALVTITMLEEAGFPASLRFGVAETKGGKIQAHAWVESMGRVVIGGSHINLEHYTVLEPLAGI